MPRKAKRKILFLTGTRADFGKMKPLMLEVDQSEGFACSVFVTGMHTLERYGYTVEEVRKSGIKRLFTFINQIEGETMDMILANTLVGLSRYVHANQPDLILVHGDRVEALAGAIVGALRNIRIGHVEGGEVSGTVDEGIRHAISKLAHVHFVANEVSKRRLVQLGEPSNSIFVTGSPDIDIMESDSLPSLDAVKKRYRIPFDDFALALFHPVTTEYGMMGRYAENFVEALVKSGRQYIVIYPNNDMGADEIIRCIAPLRRDRNFRVFPTIRFEYFITALRHARFIVGNSSAGIREAPYFGVPTVNIGTRQNNRSDHRHLIDVGYGTEEILEGIAQAVRKRRFRPVKTFGDGKSTKRFMEVLRSDTIWNLSYQKQFMDLTWDL